MHHFFPRRLIPNEEGGGRASLRPGGAPYDVWVEKLNVLELMARGPLQVRSGPLLPHLE